MDVNFLGLPALLWIPLLPLIGSAINLVLGKRLGKGLVTAVAVGSVLLAFALSAYLVFVKLLEHPNGGELAVWQQGGITQTAWSWLEVGSFKAELAFRLDSLSAVMILI